MWQGGVGQGVAEGVVWDVSGGVWLKGVAEDVAWAVVGSVDGGAWSRNGVGGVAESVGVVCGGRKACCGGCCWWYLILSGECRGWRFVAEGVCCPGCRWWCLIANVVLGVPYRESPVSPIGFLGVSLVVFGCVCGWGVLLVVLDCRCGWEVSRKVLCGVSLVVFDRGFGWEVLCWEVAWRVSGGVWTRPHDAWMGCGWEVLRGTWLVVCYGVDFFWVLWVSHIRSRFLQIQSDCGKKWNGMWGLCWHNIFLNVLLVCEDVRYTVCVMFFFFGVCMLHTENSYAHLSVYVYLSKCSCPFRAMCMICML